MQILPINPDALDDAADLFIKNFQKQRKQTPELSDSMTKKENIKPKLERILRESPGLMAVDNGHFAGYLCWFQVEGFRGTPRKGAYVPEWAHSVIEDGKEDIYRQLYTHAAQAWAQAGCQIHAVSLLAHDHTAEKCWYWNGFGLAVIDAIRSMQPLEQSPQTDLNIRKANTEDSAAIAEIELEHWHYYQQPPIFMIASSADDETAFREFLSRPKNNIWLAYDGDILAGFMRWEGYDFDSVASLKSDDAVMISGAYVRPEYRGRKSAAAMLNAGLTEYARLGIQSCALTFESFNPAAARFWPRFFHPVCHSLFRIPETSSL